MLKDLFTTQRIVGVIVFLVLSIPITVFLAERELAKQERIRQEHVKAERQRQHTDIRNEVQRRKVEQEKFKTHRSPEFVAEVPVDRTDMTPETTNGTFAPELPADNAVTVELPRYTEGPYKGMTYGEAEHQWLLEKKALNDRWFKSLDKRRALARAMVASADEELSLMLSIFAEMSPEQRVFAREEALKTLPAEEVNAFFADLDNEGVKKTTEQIVSDAEYILKSREAFKVARREQKIESEQIRQAREAHERNKPVPIL